MLLWNFRAFCLNAPNSIERLNKEIKRRTRVATLFPNEESLLRLVSAVLSEISEDWETGKVQYTARKIGSKGAIVYADGMMYTLSENGVMGLVRPTAAGYELVSSFDIPKGGKGNSWAHPVVCAGRLYIRHGDFLYVYNVR